MRTDITGKPVEIRIEQHGDGFRVWVNTQEGNVFRAYRIPEDQLILAIEKETFFTIATKNIKE